jgi:diaminopimelate decarboxylase
MEVRQRWHFDERVAMAIALQYADAMYFDAALWPDTVGVTATEGLSIGGCDVPALAVRHGTPLYVLDEATVRATARRFTDALARSYPEPATVHYAGKALLNTAIAALMAECGLGLDCVSLGEFAVARHAGVDPGAIHLHGNAKPLHELQQALAWNAGRIMVDSLDELRALGRLAADRPTRQHVLLRLNPGVRVHTHAHVQTGQLNSKFGLPIETGMAEEALRLALETPGLELAGLHMHLGSQITDLEPLRQAVGLIFEFAATMKARYGWHMREFSPGGGLGVAYAPGDPQPEIETYVSRIAEATLLQARATGLEPPRLVLEPGRSLIARAVVAIYSVLSTKTIPGIRRFVAIDGGMGDNIRPALYEARYHATRADRVEASPEAADERVTVAGRYCESGDVLLRDIDLPPLEVGALLAVPMAGAYTLSMASNYNLVTRPALLLLRDGEDYLIQRRETLDDLVARDLLPPVPGSHQARGMLSTTDEP